MTPLEVLAAHQLDIVFGTCVAVGCDWDYCDVPDDGSDADVTVLHAAHVLDTMKRAGIATAVLPEADQVNGPGNISEWVTPNDGVVWTAPGAGRVMVQRVEPGDLTPEEARALAAALLAAAAAAETGGKA